MGANERNGYESINDTNGNQINGKDFLIGVLVGGMIGSFAALLLAPKSGKDLRNAINNQANLLREKSDYIRESAFEKGNDFSISVKDRTNFISKKMSQQSIDLVNKVKHIKDHVVSEIPKNTAAVDKLFHKNPQSDAERKLEETKKAFDETESKINRK